MVDPDVIDASQAITILAGRLRAEQLRFPACYRAR
jgi:hypothetical protein